MEATWTLGSGLSLGLGVSLGVLIHRVPSAQAMFQQLRLGDASEQVSWTRMFQVMKQYCARYAPPQEAQARHPHAATSLPCWDPLVC